MSEAGRDEEDVPEVGNDDPSPVADNQVLAESSETVVPEGDHLVAAPSRGRVDTGLTPGMQVGEGVQKLRDMARINFGVSDQDITNAFNSLRKQITSGGALGQRAAEVGTTATHVLAGLFIALFCLFFFLYQGEQIWAWLVRLFPRQAREKVDSSGRKAWVSLTAFVRATIIVAAVDASGISL